MSANAQFWVGLALIFAIVTGGVVALLDPVIGFGVGIFVFFFILVIGGMCSIQPSGRG